MELHPALTHHVVNTLGWSSLRPLQQATIQPLTLGEHAILLAPTAGGKTEAAIFPLLSRMLTQDWRGLSVLYVCPLKALLNNLYPRLQQYTEMVGRTAGIWHGDVPRSHKGRMTAEPPDLLLTTPESLEVMLISASMDAHAFLGDVQVVVIDEVHAFAGDDRGWHLLAVLERLERIAGRPLQRVGLSATVGDPDGLLSWLRGGQPQDVPGRVIAPPASALTDRTELVVDYVGDVDNAATVISRLHRGEKRLVFAESRARVEELTTALRERDVTTFASHSSLSADERRRAEHAFAETRDCVIVATSTLELGIDVGDLDRVIQLDAPATVASFLQRIGRTGRRGGSVRNCTFLCLEDTAVLHVAGLLALHEDGWVEPVTPPPEPIHLLAQQIMALALQEGQIGRDLWPEWIGRLPPFTELVPTPAEEIIDWMVREAILVEEEGMLSFGVEGERTFGRRHFLELVAVFTASPLLTAYHGRREIGSLDPMSLQRKSDGDTIVLLAGRSWKVGRIDWGRRQAFLEPVEQRGKSRWNSGGRALSFEVSQAMATVVDGRTPTAHWSQRASSVLDMLRDELPPAGTTSTTVTTGGSRPLWWTYAGKRANAILAEHLDVAQSVSSCDDLSITLRPKTTGPEAAQAIRRLQQTSRDLVVPSASPTAISGLKFSECLPVDVALDVLSTRLHDPRAIDALLNRSTTVTAQTD